MSADQTTQKEYTQKGDTFRIDRSDMYIEITACGYESCYKVSAYSKLNPGELLWRSNHTGVQEVAHPRTIDQVQTILKNGGIRMPEGLKAELPAQLEAQKAAVERATQMEVERAKRMEVERSRADRDLELSR